MILSEIHTPATAAPPSLACIRLHFLRTYNRSRTVVDCEKKSVSRSVELELAGEVKDIKLPEFFGLIKRLVLMTGQVEHRTTDNQEHGDTPAREDTDKEEERAGRYRLPRKRTVKRQTRTRYARDAGN